MLQSLFQQLILERDPLFITVASTTTDHRTEGGLQHAKTALIIGQHHAQRIHNENGNAATSRITPKTNLRTLQMIGVGLGLRSP